MRMTTVIAALRSLVKSLWSFARSPASLARPNTPHPMSEPLPATPSVGVLEPKLPQAGSTPPDASGEQDGPSGNRPTGGSPTTDSPTTEGGQLNHPDTVEKPETSESDGVAEGNTDAALNGLRKMGHTSLEGGEADNLVVRSRNGRILRLPPVRNWFAGEFPHPRDGRSS